MTRPSRRSSQPTRLSKYLASDRYALRFVPHLLSFAASYACCKKSETVTAAKIPLTKRVTRGANTKPKPSVAATHGAEHHGQVTKSPIARCNPSPLDFSITSPPPADSLYSVKGARNGAVTQSLVIRRVSL